MRRPRKGRCIQKTIVGRTQQNCTAAPAVQSSASVTLIRFCADTAGTVVIYMSKESPGYKVPPSYPAYQAFRFVLTFKIRYLITISLRSFSVVCAIILPYVVPLRRASIASAVKMSSCAISLIVNGLQFTAACFSAFRAVRSRCAPVVVTEIKVRHGCAVFASALFAGKVHPSRLSMLRHNDHLRTPAFCFCSSSRYAK